ncbi:hypothetical protein CVS47_02088 [Microbacterium lemovicicum]|jgi:hypothetical protein|uniref:Uncharacterized protein n=1 Tax=Microbacterium lemovicicum TaxID=1072463 RepID=A0A3Q9J0P9_9MICO|nr:hypothetical protein [Microbacterium lemovicicum]AZS37451.1 hypothetical protein CVS47_02088 [Microbacterium lemovicicum]
MKTVIYAGDAFVTGDAIADAVLRYSRILAEAGTADTVTIPVRRRDGVRVDATLLLGPASQIVAESQPDDEGEEIEDGGLVDELNARADTRDAPVGLPVDDPTPGWDDQL